MQKRLNNIGPDSVEERCKILNLVKQFIIMLKPVFKEASAIVAVGHLSILSPVTIHEEKFYGR